jgi:hypothetical protein
VEYKIHCLNSGVIGAFGKLEKVLADTTGEFRNFDETPVYVAAVEAHIESIAK